MVEIPTAVFYITATALCVICVFLAVLLFYIVKIARIILQLLTHVEHGSAYVKERLTAIRDIFSVITKIFGR